MKNDLTIWLDDVVYPRLRHEIVFGHLEKFNKRGRDFWACCPVHDEKTPSFNMKEGQPFGHCFGCDANVGWYAAVENRVGKDRVIEELARLAGVEPLTFAENPKSKAIRAWWEAARQAVWDNPNILTYLRDRGYTDDLIQKMDVGTFPGDAIPEGVMAPAISHPLLFPVYRKGQLVACVGRAVEPGKGPKYIYPKGFSVSRYLLGVRRVDQTQPIVIVEGLFDAIVLSAHGIQAAAVGTSSISAEQISRLPENQNIILVLDVDEAGQKGTVKAVWMLQNRRVYVVSDLDGAKDPDELIREKGISAFREKLEHAESAHSFYIRYVAKNYATETDAEKDKTLSKAVKYITHLPSMLDQERSLTMLSSCTGLSLGSLRAEIARLHDEEQAKRRHQEIEKRLQQAQEAVNKKDYSQFETIITDIRNISRQKVQPVAVDYDCATQKFLSRPDGISFPWRELNRLGKMLPGCITTIIGGTSHGKTSVATALALHFLAEGKKVVYWSGEIPEDVIVQKMTAYLANLPFSGVAREQSIYYRGDPVVKSMLYARAIMESYCQNLYIPEARDFVEIDSLVSYCSQADADVLIVDYIQQLRPSGDGKKYRTRDEEIEYVLETLNFWCWENRKYVIALGQMNREAKNTAKPEIVYARHSATIEHYSSMVLGVWNSSMVAITSDEKGDVPIDGWYMKTDQTETEKAVNYALEQGKSLLEVSILKNRHFGNVNKAVPLLFDGATGRIEDFPEHEFAGIGKTVSLTKTKTG